MADFLAIMGASGSGKSTFMNILGCLDRPSSGKYMLEGTDVSEYDKKTLAHNWPRDSNSACLVVVGTERCHGDAGALWMQGARRLILGNHGANHHFVALTQLSLENGKDISVNAWSVIPSETLTGSSPLSGRNFQTTAVSLFGARGGFELPA